MMNLKRTVISAVCLLLSVIVILSSCGETEMGLEKSLSKFSSFVEQIERGKISDISATVYYHSPYVLLLCPIWSVDRLMKQPYTYKVEVSGSELKEHLDLLKRIDGDNLTPLDGESRMDVRIYCVFEKKGRKVLDIVMWGSGGSMFVNGSEVEESDVLCGIVKAFLKGKEDEALVSLLFNCY